MFGAEIVNGLLAGRGGTVVVDDHVAAGRELGVQSAQGIHGGGVHLAVQTKDGELLDRGCGESVLEPADEEADAFIEQAVAREVGLDPFERDAEAVIGFPVAVAGVLLIAAIGFRQTLEGVGHPNDSVGIAAGL